MPYGETEGFVHLLSKHVKPAIRIRKGSVPKSTSHARQLAVIEQHAFKPRSWSGYAGSGTGGGSRAPFPASSAPSGVRDSEEAREQGEGGGDEGVNLQPVHRDGAGDEHPGMTIPGHGVKQQSTELHLSNYRATLKRSQRHGRRLQADLRQVRGCAVEIVGRIEGDLLENRRRHAKDIHGTSQIPRELLQKLKEAREGIYLRAILDGDALQEASSTGCMKITCALCDEGRRPYVWADSARVVY
jgi:hypothetical protein